MKNHTLIALIAIGLCASVFAAETRQYARISFVLPGSGRTTISRDQLVVIVIEGPYVTHEQKPLPATGMIEYVNGLLKSNGGDYIGVYIREGVRYGDVVRALDSLSQTQAKNIGVSMHELPVGREP